MDPLCNEPLTCCCNHYYTTAALMSLTQMYGHLVLFGGGAIHMEVTWWWVEHLGCKCPGQCWTHGDGYVKQHDSPHEHAEMLSWSVAYPGILFFLGGVQQIQFRTDDRENGDL